MRTSRKITHKAAAFSLLFDMQKHIYSWVFASFSDFLINVWFMSYLTCWNCRRTWNLCCLLNIQLKKYWIKKNTNHSYWALKLYLFWAKAPFNSMKVSQNAKFSLQLFSAEGQKKIKIPSSTTISTLQIWHEGDINSLISLKKPL